MQTLKTIEVQLPKITVRQLETTEDLETLRTWLQEGSLKLEATAFDYHTPPQQAIESLYVSDSGKALDYPIVDCHGQYEYYEWKGEVTKLAHVIAQVGDLLLTNENNHAAIQHHTNTIPNWLTDPIFITKENNS